MEIHIREIMDRLGTELSRMDKEPVYSKYEKEGLVPCFLGERIGINRTFENIRNYKTALFQTVCKNYLEASEYYYLLKKNERTMRCLDAILYHINMEINNAKNKQKKDEQ